MKNKAAAALGRLAKGVPKKFSKAEIERRTKRIKQANRWPVAKRGGQER